MYQLHEITDPNKAIPWQIFTQVENYYLHNRLQPHYCFVSKNRYRCIVTVISSMRAHYNWELSSRTKSFFRNGSQRRGLRSQLFQRRYNFRRTTICKSERQTWIYQIGSLESIKLALALFKEQWIAMGLLQTRICKDQSKDIHWNLARTTIFCDDNNF